MKSELKTLLNSSLLNKVIKELFSDCSIEKFKFLSIKQRKLAVFLNLLTLHLKAQSKIANSKQHYIPVREKYISILVKEVLKRCLKEKQKEYKELLETDVFFEQDF